VIPAIRRRILDLPIIAWLIARDFVAKAIQGATDPLSTWRVIHFTERRAGLEALRRLDEQARRIDDVTQGPSLADYVAMEREHSVEFGGRTVTSAGP
jgi:hypothetical protein